MAECGVGLKQITDNQQKADRIAFLVFATGNLDIQPVVLAVLFYPGIKLPRSAAAHQVDKMLYQLPG